MYRLIIIFCLFFLLPFMVVYATEKPLKPEEVLNLRNYELSIQNLNLQIEILNCEIERVMNKRNNYLNELYKNYGLDRLWKIDLEKGIWFTERAPKAKDKDGANTDE